MYGIDFFMPEIKNRRDIRPCGLSVFLCFRINYFQRKELLTSLSDHTHP